ncbi:MAG: exodeoxyribonuclease VII small subunit [Muribaculaceae bacterium]|nr:exodeoxyribonuclease VII small subunit [Muribaculaceae bacterium]
MDNVKSYSEAVEELENIVAMLQSDKCKIDDLKAYAQKSVELIKFCKSHLSQTDDEIKKLLDNIKDESC